MRLSIKSVIDENLTVEEKTLIHKSYYRANRIKAISVILSIIAIIICIFNILVLKNFSILPIIVFSIVFANLFAFHFVKPNYSLLEQKVIPKTIKKIDESAVYLSDTGMLPKNYIASEIGTGCEIYSSNKSIKIDNEDFTFHSAYIIDKERRERVDSDGHTYTETVIVFEGLFAKVDLKFESVGKYKLIHDMGILNSLSFNNKDKTTLESNEFEKMYEVYASDKITLRKIFTPSLMQDIIDINNKVNGKKDDIEISIINSTLYFKISINEFLSASKIKLDVDYSKYEKDLEFVYDTYVLAGKIAKQMKKI